MKTLKSIGAIVIGLLTVALLSVLTDTILEKAGVTPPQNQEVYIPWMLAMALGYRSIYAIMGGYVTAKLAPAQPMRHAIILGIIGTLAAVAGIIVQRNLPNIWYPVALAVTALPFTWLGGKIGAK